MPLRSHGLFSYAASQPESQLEHTLHGMEPDSPAQFNRSIIKDVHLVVKKGPNAFLGITASACACNTGCQAPGYFALGGA